MNFHLERIDTLAGQYYTPKINNNIDLSIVRNRITFDEMAHGIGLRKQDTVWYDPQHQTLENAVPAFEDSLDRLLYIDEPIRFSQGVNEEVNLALISRIIDSNELIHLYVKQHRTIEQYRDDYVSVCIENSFEVLKKHE